MRVHAWLILFTACAFTVTAQSDNKVLSSEKIIKLIPDRLIGFNLSDDSQSKVIRLGNLQYSMAEKRFTASKQRSIKILLFDYKEAPIMYNQATFKFHGFTAVESDSVILRSILMTDCTGWESYNIIRKDSQILLGICNRFFLSIEGKNVDIESLKQVVYQFKIETFPK